MRASLVASTVLALLVAGCVSAPEAQPEGALSLAGYTLVCDVAKGNASWREPCLAFASPNDSPGKTEIDLSVNPNDPENVVVGSKDLDPMASDCVWAVPQVTKDGGRTWATNIIGGPVASRQPQEPLYGWRCITDPIMAWAPDGTLYYSLQAYDHTLRDRQIPTGGAANPGSVGSSILMARSKDGGDTWERIITLHTGAGPIFHDYMRMAVNPKTGSVYTIWNQFNTNAGVGPLPPGTPTDVIPVMGISRDGGQTAAPPTYIHKPNTLMSGFAVANDGTISVLLEDGDDAWFTTSTDDGASFSEPVKVPQLHGVRIKRQVFGEAGEAFRATGAYELAVDNSGGPRDGWIYATISDAAKEDDANVFVSVSQDKGKTWSEPVQVNTGEFARGMQWMPRPVVDRLGTLHMLYFDNSRQTQPLSTMLDTTWALSTDGGRTFLNARLTTIAADGNLGLHQDGFPFIGDYNGIGTVGDWLYMGFPTTHTGRAEIAVAKVALPR